MFAIVTISGKQYNVKKGDVITVDKIDGEAGSTITLDHVLLTTEGAKTVVGTPVVKGAKVEAKVIAQEKGVKIDVLRYKQKVRHRRHIGFRAHQTKLEIVSVG
jgi:large subunit ribosomal protein L21